MVLDDVIVFGGVGEVDVGPAFGSFRYLMVTGGCVEFRAARKTEASDLEGWERFRVDGRHVGDDAVHNSLEANGGRQ